MNPKLDTPHAASPNDLADWLVVGASLSAIFVSVLHVYSMGVLIAPLERAFGWPRAQISGGLLVISVLSVCAAPFVGLAVDRFGSRRVGLLGLSIYCPAIALLSTTGPSIYSWLALWGLVAVGAVLIKPTVWVAAIARRFTGRRGIAFAIALCGTSIAATVLPVLVSLLSASAGWRTAYAALGLGAAIVAIPLVLLFIRDLPSADKSQRDETPLLGLTKREGLTSPVFFKLAVCSLFVTTSVIGLVVHLVPIITEGGLSPLAAASVAGVIGLGSITGRLVSGMLLDRFPGRIVGAVSFTLPIIGCLLFANVDLTYAWAIVFAAILGASVGAEIDVLAFLSARYFGLAHYGLLFGTLGGIINLGSGAGPTLFGYLYDRFGSYDIALWVPVPLLLISVVLVASLGAEPDFAVREDPVGFRMSPHGGAEEPSRG